MEYTTVDLMDATNIDKKDWGPGILIFSDELADRNAQVIGFLNSKDGLGRKMNARDCVVKQVAPADGKKFVEENHIQGPNNLSLVFFGLFSGDELVAVMSLGRHSRNISENRIVLDRFCVKSGVVVRGGASKIFKEAAKWAKERKYRGDQFQRQQAERRQGLRGNGLLPREGAPPRLLLCRSFFGQALEQAEPEEV